MKLDPREDFARNETLREIYSETHKRIATNYYEQRMQEKLKQKSKPK